MPCRRRALSECAQRGGVLTVADRGVSRAESGILSLHCRSSSVYQFVRTKLDRLSFPS